MHRSHGCSVEKYHPVLRRRTSKILLDSNTLISSNKNQPDPPTPPTELLQATIISELVLTLSNLFQAQATIHISLYINLKGKTT
jgi:hypothetical protein